MNLTAAINRDYSFSTSEKNEVGFDILVKAAIGRKVSSNAAFLLRQCARSLRAGWAGAARPPVRFSGMSTCLVPPTRLTSGSGSFNELKSEYIMTNTPLVPVFTGTIQNQSIQLCNARDLHQFLESGREFATWIKDRIKQYSFTEGEDYLTNLSNRSDGKSGKRRTEYHLTLDMAKELAMVENNEKGRQIRRYFISLERKALPAPEPKRYRYPRKLLEQPYFTAPKLPAGLDINMLGDSRNFSSPLMALLNDLRTDGHEIDAAWDEFIAMREGIQKFSDFLKNLQIDALKTWVAEASTSLRKQ